jgi:hypothetical protein
MSGGGRLRCLCSTICCFEPVCGLPFLELMTNPGASSPSFENTPLPSGRMRFSGALAGPAPLSSPLLFSLPVHVGAAGWVVLSCLCKCASRWAGSGWLPDAHVNRRRLQAALSSWWPKHPCPLELHAGWAPATCQPPTCIAGRLCVSSCS